jgi:polar amino acid transport system substrate-binding protein
MSLKTIAAAVIAALILAAPAGAVRAEVLRIGTEGAYPPFNQIDPSGELIGFDIDIAQALCDNMKVTCEFVRQDWDGIIPGLLARKYDAIIASMSITEERKRAVDFTDPYYSNKLRFVAAEGAGLDPQNLKGKVVGAQRATISASYLEDHPIKGAKVKLYDTQENAYLDLASGRVDVILADMLVSHEWLNSAAGEGFAFLGEPIDIGDTVGIAVRKGDTELLARLNAALASIIADGTYEELNAKYFPFPIY